MNGSLDALVLAAGVLAAAAAALGALTPRHTRQAVRGWVLALGTAAAGTVAAAAAQAFPSAVSLSSGAALLLLAWPALVLGGWRRFRPRQPLPGGHRLDAAVTAAAALLLLLGAPAPALIGGLHLAAALPLLWPARPADGAGGADTPALALAALLVVGGLAPGAATLLAEAAAGTTGFSHAAAPAAWADAWGTLAGRALATALAGVALACLGVTLVHERTERRLRQSRARLRVLANLDPLTDVPNRRHFAETAVRALAADPQGRAVLLMFDIDHFKLINDRYGHAAGDRALRVVAQAMVEHLRGDDVAGRHGGDEFVLLLRSAGTAEAVSVAARITHAVQRRTAALQLPPLTLSFGLVQVSRGEALPDALQRADQALYEAKRQGRARAVTASGDAERPEFAVSQRLGLPAV